MAEQSGALEVIDVEPREFVPTLVMTPDKALAKYRAFQDFRSKVLIEGTDYGVVPGTDKPSLLKPGAEKLATAFAFAVEFVPAKCVEDWQGGFFFYTYECRLTHRPTGTLVATCYGSANSKEGRYRWRSLPTWKATAADKERAVRTEQRNKRDGGKFTVYIVENDDPYTLVNTLQKMAQKRAFVGAVLLATNASDSFTQDVEDYTPEPEADVIDATPTVVAEPDAERRREPAPSAPTALMPKYDQLITHLRVKRLWPENYATTAVALLKLRGADREQTAAQVERWHAKYATEPAVLLSDLQSELAELQQPEPAL